MPAVAGLLFLAGTPMSVAAQTPVQAAQPLPADPVLASLIEESLAVRPEVQQAVSAAKAERERVPQAGALPDPVLSLGIQNDGFDEIMIGKMETSYWQVMVSQGLPWPGKRDFRTDVARIGAEQAEASVTRAQLGAEAEVRRSYIDLLLARDRLALLSKLEELWMQSAGLARARYESSEGAQSDVLRAQLELSRLRQRRASLQAAEKTSLQSLNRLRARPLDAPIVTRATIRDLQDPWQADLAVATDDAVRRSPELARARLGVTRATTALALSRRERFPDLAVNAGVMPRGQLDPMWVAGISVGLPIWSGRKQGRSVAENAARAESDARGAEAVEQVLRLRVAERQAALAALLETIRIYRGGLLVQSQATVDSTIAQYRVGRVTFASVLEANAGLLNDEEGFLSTLSEAHRLAIAAYEVSLDPVASSGGGGMSGTPVPGAGASVNTASSPSAGGAAPAAAATPSMSSGM